MYICINTKPVPQKSFEQLPYIVQLSRSQNRSGPYAHDDRITQSIASPILPPGPPPLLPEAAVKLLLPQLAIDGVVRLAHPVAELGAAGEPRLVAPSRLVHPRAEIVRAHPARVQAREEVQERAHLGLLLGRGRRRVCGCQRVQECPC